MNDELSAEKQIRYVILLKCRGSKYPLEATEVQGVNDNRVRETPRLLDLLRTISHN